MSSAEEMMIATLQDGMNTSTLTHQSSWDQCLPSSFLTSFEPLSHQWRVSLPPIIHWSKSRMLIITIAFPLSQRTGGMHNLSKW